MLARVRHPGWSWTPYVVVVVAVPLIPLVFEAAVFLLFFCFAIFCCCFWSDRRWGVGLYQHITNLAHASIRCMLWFECCSEWMHPVPSVVPTCLHLLP